VVRDKGFTIKRFNYYEQPFHGHKHLLQFTQSLKSLKIHSGKKYETIPNKLRKKQYWGIFFLLPPPNLPFSRTQFYKTGRFYENCSSTSKNIRPQFQLSFPFSSFGLINPLPLRRTIVILAKN